MNERRLVVVDNLKSTRSAQVEREVHMPLRVNNISYVPFRTRSPHTEDNITDLTDFLRDGDRVISAAGDGTGNQVANAAIDRDIEVGFMPFGNFNDLSEYKRPNHLGGGALALTKSEDVRDTYPLDISVNSDHWRYAPAYSTVGWTARAASQFGNVEFREQMRGAPESLKLLKSLAKLGIDYFQNRHEYLPAFHTDDDDTVRRAVTDVVALNNARMGGVMRYEQDLQFFHPFAYHELDVSQLMPNAPFLARAALSSMPVELVPDMTLYFEQPSQVPIHTEGEFALLDDVSSLSFAKGEHVLKVVR